MLHIDILFCFSGTRKNPAYSMYWKSLYKRILWLFKNPRKWCSCCQRRLWWGIMQYFYPLCPFIQKSLPKWKCKIFVVMQCVKISLIHYCLIETCYKSSQVTVFNHNPRLLIIIIENVSNFISHCGHSCHVEKWDNFWAKFYNYSVFNFPIQIFIGSYFISLKEKCRVEAF